MCSSLRVVRTFTLLDPLHPLALRSSRYFHNILTSFAGVLAQIACANDVLLSPGSYCAFFQNGASGTLYEAIGFMQNLRNATCSICGSSPTETGNDVSKGELTVNYASNGGCNRNYLGDPDAVFCPTQSLSGGGGDLPPVGGYGGDG
jgi:hypothetical protein